MSEYIFTFGCCQENADKCQVVVADNWDLAREIMCDMYGEKWCWQYTGEEWKTMKNNPKRTYLMETELPTKLHAKEING